MNKKLWEFLRAMENKHYHILWFTVIVSLMVFITAIVYFTGGTSSTVQLLYVPIFIAVFVYGIKGGIIAAIFAGLAVGPFMPAAATGEMQPTAIWILRILTSVFIVLVVGKLYENVKKMDDLEKKRAYEDVATGYFNSNKFNIDWTDSISAGAYGSISTILFRFENMDMIKRYVDFETSMKSYIRLLEMAEEFFYMGTVYTISDNKIAILLPGVDIDRANNLTKGFISISKSPMYIENLPISPVIKCGIVNYPNHGTEACKLTLMLDKALEQTSRLHSTIGIYNDIIEKEHERYYSDLVSLYHALKNDMFTLAFQPIIDVRKNRISSVEALLRWNDSRHINMSIAELIKRAEDAGFINEITKWLFASVAEQIKLWNEKGIEIPVSMNLSALDLSDAEFISYVTDYIKENHINTRLIEFELTERSIIHNEEIMSEQLMKLKKLGIKLSLDDYGTGHNSLKNLMNFAGKFDYLKIDKVFIDKILKDEKLIMVDCIIRAAHRMGMKVVAEGVEIHEQVEILRTVDCDMIQGFYYSMPLPPEELEQYVLGPIKHEQKYAYH